MDSATVSEVTNVVVTDMRRRALLPRQRQDVTDLHLRDSSATRDLDVTDQLSVSFDVVMGCSASSRTSVVDSLEDDLGDVLESTDIVSSWSGTHLASASVDR